MQSRSAQALQEELHGSSGAQKRRHQDDNVFLQPQFHPSQIFGLAQPLGILVGPIEVVGRFVEFEFSLTCSRRSLRQ